MVINKNATKLYASSFNSVVYTFNISTYSPTPSKKLAVLKNDTKSLIKNYYIKFIYR